MHEAPYPHTDPCLPPPVSIHSRRPPRLLSWRLGGSPRGRVGEAAARHPVWPAHRPPGRAVPGLCGQLCGPVLGAAPCCAARGRSWPGGGGSRGGGGARGRGGGEARSWAGRGGGSVGGGARTWAGRGGSSGGRGAPSWSGRPTGGRRRTPAAAAPVLGGRLLPWGEGGERASGRQLVSDGATYCWMPHI